MGTTAPHGKSRRGKQQEVFGSRPERWRKRWLPAKRLGREEGLRRPHEGIALRVAAHTTSSTSSARGARSDASPRQGAGTAIARLAISPKASRRARHVAAPARILDVRKRGGFVLHFDINDNVSSSVREWAQ
jgi:hypothetical protein